MNKKNFMVSTLLGIFILILPKLGFALLQTPSPETTPRIPTEINYQGATSGQYSDEITLKSLLKVKDSQTPISDKKISWQAESYSLGTATTNNQGVAQKNYKITLPSGNYNLLSIFEGDDQYQGSSFASSLSVSKEDLKINYTGPTSGTEDTNVTLSAEISELDSSVGNLASKKIVFQLGTIKRSANTDSQGKAEVTFYLDLSPGTYNLNVSFEGDAYYKSANYSTNFEVKRKTTGGGGGGGGGCFAERLLENTRFARILDYLRIFRDNFLAKIPWGKDLISFYYKDFSPLAIEFLDLIKNQR